jgi:predicted RNA-binding Zn-ribbon protein involved in translation (DUF1610 family)
MKVIQVKCPNCEQPIYQKQRDNMFHCKNCGTIHYRDMKGSHTVEYEIADVNPNVRGRQYYIPFWRVYCHFNIRSRDVEGGYIHKLATKINGGDNGGMLYIFVPASDLEASTFRSMAVNLTVNNPRYNLRRDFSNVERMPTTLTPEEAAEMADFVAVTLEAEKPGKMQYLDYELKVQETKLVYLPFEQGPNGLQLAV